MGKGLVITKSIGHLLPVQFWKNIVEIDRNYVCDSQEIEKKPNNY